MNTHWHKFIFSEGKKYTILRHLVFWVSWWLYFVVSFFLFQQPVPGGIKPLYLSPGDHLLLKTFLLLLLFAPACYSLIYFILPVFIGSQWVRATAYLLLLCIFVVAGTHFLYWNIFSSIDLLFNTSTTELKLSRLWPSINLGFMNFIKVASAAAIIRYIKYWWQKEKESQRLQKEKIDAELQLLKAQVHPDFLFKTLNNIEDHALSSSPETSGMLLKLSDLLSYMLYECEQPTVSLEKEITMMKEYMLLEKIRYPQAPEVQVNVKGDLSGKSIAPFLLLPFIENSFRHGTQMSEPFWINLDIRVEGDRFSMKLTNGLSEKYDDSTPGVADGLVKAERRLESLYPGKHELKISREQEMFIVLLAIRLETPSALELQAEVHQPVNAGRLTFTHF